ncbi:hypothetical protein [Providencia burhodogranariea]|uniref:Uncharacterized protein n=1 Tax=Providencia burhodogranariea DSM 19968 TaxID=1141662 RepID=K8WJG4_9GAMM|nr:hypothetical protein [Providencia burhodogranariea]EKT60684.1 hypothetical protein OOA_11628 [Providencia burhodogranariea DSM 19968]
MTLGQINKINTVWHTVKAHGAPFIVQTPNQKLLTGKAGATVFANNIKQVYSVNFMSCYSANGGHFSNAQMLSNALNVPVKGYYGKVNMVSSQISGHNKVFKPQSNLKSKVCGVGNTLLGSIVKPPVKALLFFKKHLHI